MNTTGFGGASYVDLVVCRDKDTNTSWTSASDGTLEERVYYCQNWRADVSAIVSAAGGMLEWAKYSAYGVPFGLPGGDADSDGDCDAADATQIQAWINAPAYDIRGDIDIDGDIDLSDKSQSLVIAAPGGHAILSPTLSSRHGAAGYENCSITAYNVRHRFLLPNQGQWASRDPLEYQPGESGLYQYAALRPLVRTDPMGLAPAWWDNLTGCTVSVPVAPPGVEVPQVICDGRNNGDNPDQSACIMNGGSSYPAVRDTDLVIVCTKNPPQCCVCNTEGMSYCTVLMAGTLSCETWWGNPKQVTCQCFGSGTPQYDQAQQALRRCANGQRPFP